MADDVKHRIVELLPRLRRFAFALTGCADRGEDLLQETCVKAIARAHQWQQGTRLDSWLFRIAQNHWIDTMRAGRHMKESSSIDDVPLPDPRASQSAFAHHHHYAIRAAVSALPPEQRSVVVLVCVEGCAYREAAEILELPIGTIMSRLARARKSLHRTLYGDEDAAEGEVSSDV